ncbi:hypothetical protein [Mucilaginibacter sp.]|uniref:hypothetical protein n=1 Tax=Mucilaginibacter sp. TaxID=1882438 RepID=UPI00283D1288|nr:hypothetical protein [Mucilaginibacter sp.]MDR3695116.1 hypothetical protein [Mucilaginibacter sp.]
MLQFKVVLSLFFVCLLGGFRSFSQQLVLKAAGDAQNGYHVDIYNGKTLIVTNTEELSLQLFNHDLTTVAKLDHLKGQKWTGNENRITLSNDLYIPEFDADLSITVSYQVVNANLVKKTIQLFQPSMPGMYYILQETARPAKTPQRYVTFEEDNFPGGFAHEMFPAAGFVTPDNDVVGFLTDAGYKNQYTRNMRRRFSGRDGGFTGLRRLPDVNLFSVADLSERAKNEHYIRQTFGEMYNLDAGDSTLLTIDPVDQKAGNAEIGRSGGLTTITCHKGPQSGINFITPFKDQRVYTVSFWYKGNTAVALKLFRLKNGQKTVELEDGMKYIDNLPIDEKNWTYFKRSILVPYIEKDSVSMFIGAESGKETRFEIKGMKIIENHPQKEAYNILPLGEKVEKNTYIFVEPWKSHQQFMISAQTRLAEGKGFRGSMIEKMLYANFNMLTWITDVDNFKPFNVPNMNYAPDMYNRDSFFSTVSTYNRELNLSIWEEWGKTQTSKGSIGTIITPLMGSVEAKDNEATIEWLIWAMLNKRRFGVKLPHEKIEKAVSYVLNEFDPGRSGKCRSHFPMNQLDIIDYNPKTDRLAVNQGMLVIALKTIKELGFSISDAYIQKAENGYRNFYDVKRKHLLFDRNFPDMISLTDLEPEFFSLWLFKTPILTDEMVQNELEQIPVLNKVANSPHPEYGTTAPILIRLTKDARGWAYLSGDYQPFGKFGEENYSDGKTDGFYYNGGSWFRPEYCAYVVGLKHGWKKARPLMENRVWAEIYLNPNWPFSKEFTPTKWVTTDSWWPSTKGLCWNVFILMADEVAGLRKPEMDPDYHK